MRASRLVWDPVLGYILLAIATRFEKRAGHTLAPATTTVGARGLA